MRLRSVSTCVQLRHLLLWLLALVVPLQGLAVTFTQVRGPAHTHVRSDTSLVLVDFRRDLGRTVERGPIEGLLIEALHGHPHAETRFHHHAFDDRSVVYVDGDRFGDPADRDGSVAGDGAATFLPLPMLMAPWIVDRTRHASRNGPLWTPTTAYAARLERPPQASLA